MPYKITRSESYKADQTKSGESLKHYGRKGMKWDKNIFGKDDAPGQSRSSSNSGSAQSKKALSSALNSQVSAGRGGSLNKNKIVVPEYPSSGTIWRTPKDKPYPVSEGYRSGKIPDPILKSGGRGEAKPRSGLQKWFDQAGKDIGNTFNSAKKGVEDAANSVKKWGEGAVNDTKKWVEGAANDTKKWTDNAIKDIGKTAVKIGDDAKKAYGDAEKWVNGAIKDVGNAAVKVGDDAKKAYGDAEKWVNTAIGDTKKWTDQAGKDIGKAAGDVKKWGEGAVNDTKKWTDQAGKDVSTFVDNLINGSNSKQAKAEYAAREAKEAALQRRRDWRTALNYGEGPRRPEKDIIGDLYTNGSPSKRAREAFKDVKPDRDIGMDRVNIMRDNYEKRAALLEKHAPKTKAPELVSPRGKRANKYFHEDEMKAYRQAVASLSKNPRDPVAKRKMEAFEKLATQRQSDERVPKGYFTENQLQEIKIYEDILRETILKENKN